MPPISNEPLLAPLIAVGAAVILFIITLIFQRLEKPKAVKHEADGTKYVQENGQTVRRSTR